MVEEKTPSQDTVQISGHITLQNVSYDKDVMEIKLADTVDSDNYGSNFVKDVCVDEGALLHRKISDKKPVDKRSSPNFSCQMIEANSEIICGKKDGSRKSVHEQKPEAVVPVDLARDRKKEQHFSSKEYGSEYQTTTGCIAGDPSEKKISLQELLRLESEEESRQATTTNSESSEKHNCPVHEEALGQAISTNTSEHASSGITNICSGTMSDDHDITAASDVREPHKIDRYNPCIDHRSLEDASEPEGSIPGITDTASPDSICSVDSVASGSTGLDEVKTAEPRTDTVNTSSSDIPASTSAADETTVATSSSSSGNAEPSNANGENQEKCVPDRAADHRIDEENCTGTDDAVTKSSNLAQDLSVAEQTKPESSKSSDRSCNEDPSEPNFFGPSIMSGAASMSGHIGNVSLRSDSSTTSTRSFAFPVLQREWNSSPVRMAKAERRRTRRPRVWRRGLIICCKF